MNFPYHAESVSQHVDVFKQKNVGKKCREKTHYFPRRGEGGTPTWKIPRK